MNPYRVLRVKKTATLAEITAAYRGLALRWHPDKNPGDAKAAAKFVEINQAYEILSDSDRRARYDATGDTTFRHENNAISGAVEVLAVVFTLVVKQIVEQGGDVKKEDIVTHMRNVLAQQRQERTKAILNIEKAKAALTEAATRFTAEDGEENYFAGIIRHQIHELENMLAQQTAEEEKSKAALKLLAKFKYRVDAFQRLNGYLSGTGTGTTGGITWRVLRS